MGGNVRINNIDAQRIDLTLINRSNLVSTMNTFFGTINKDLSLWNKFVTDHRLHLSGSSNSLFNNEINDLEYVMVKPSVGDIDLQVPLDRKTDILDYLDTYKKTNPKLVGYKNSADQTITLWYFEEFDLNIQIDFEYVDYQNGKPTQWASFSHSSPWEDMRLGIKGVAHKFILRALLAKDLKEVTVETKKGSKEIISAEWAFSPSGLRQKLIPLDKTIDGKIVFKEIKTSETTFIKDLKIIFHHFFGMNSDPRQIEKMGSFVGVIDLVSKLYTDKEKNAVADGFVNTVWGNGAQVLYRDDIDRDKSEKTTMVDYMCNSLKIDPIKFGTIKEEYYDKRNKT